MIIKSKNAIVDTNTYDSFYKEYYESIHAYKLLAVNKNTGDRVNLYSGKSDEGDEPLDNLMGIIYEYLDSDVTRLDLGV